MSNSPSILRGLSRSPPAWALLTLLLLALLSSILTDVVWTGSATIPLEFIVVDAESDMPVSGALVQLKEGRPEYDAPITTQDGRTKLIIKARCGGRSSIFGRTRSVNYGQWEAQVTAQDYEVFRDTLSNLTRDPRYHDKEPVCPPIRIRLGRKGDKNITETK